MTTKLNLKSIRREYKSPKPSITRIAKLSGMPISTLNNILTGIRSADEKTEDKIIRAYQQACEEVKK